MDKFKIGFIIWTGILLLSIVSSKTIDDYATSSNVTAESRAYVPDAQFLDFVYHNHEEMTKFLR